MAGDKPQRPGVPLAAVVILLVCALGFAGFWYLDYKAKHYVEAKPTLTPEAKAYTRNLKLADVQIKASESYMKVALVEVEGKITNSGDRVLKLVEINCVFRDAYGQLVLRERVPIVGRRTGTLNPGETKPFRLAFDNLPESWNQSMPELVIAQIVFG